MLILCLLANAWGDRVQRERKIKIFRVNPQNTSGRRMLKICEGHDMWFGNVSPVWCTNPNTKVKPDCDHTRAVLKIKDWDVVIVCGRQAMDTVELLDLSAILEDRYGVVDFIGMPHPASRSLTNALCGGVKKLLTEVAEQGTGSEPCQFVQYKGYYVDKFWDVG